MPETPNAQSLGTAIAGGAIASALVETLFDKGLLSLEESRSVLDRALRAVSPVLQTPEGQVATQMITGMMSGRFSARR